MKKLTAIFLGVILAFAICETGARLYHLVELKNFPVAPDKVDDFGSFENMVRQTKEILWIQDIQNDTHAYYEPFTATENRPNYHVKVKNHDLQFNSMGFRGDELIFPKPKGIFRVFILGGSTVAGQFNEKWTISHYLERDLRKFIPGAEVVNAGSSGYTSDNELILLETKIMKLDPDFIIVFDGSNSLHYSMYPERGPYFILKRLLDKLVNHATLGSLLIYDLRFLLHKSYFVMLVYRKLVIKPMGPATPTARVISPEGIRNYLDDATYMRAILEAKGIPAILAFQPALGYCKDHLTDYEKSIVSYHQKNNLGYWFDQVKSVWPMVGERFRSFPPSPFVTTVDLSCLFKNEPDTMYLDVVHYGPEADEKIAAKLAELTLAKRTKGPGIRRN